MFFKLGVAPFHFWIPGIYENAPILITLIFLTLPKFIFFCLFIKFFYFLFYSYNYLLVNGERRLTEREMQFVLFYHFYLVH